LHRRIIHKFRFEWRKRFALRSSINVRRDSPWIAHEVSNWLAIAGREPGLQVAQDAQTSGEKVLFDTDNLQEVLSLGSAQNWVGLEQDVVRAEGLEPSWAV